jgi:hypothetical protein
MKKRAIQLIFVFVLLAAVVYFLATKKQGTIKNEVRNFAVEDTASVTKIFLVDKENNSILLERTATNWKLNSNYIARQDLVNILLKTIARMQVKEPVAKAAQENIIRNLAVKSTKVELYQHKKLVRVFYVGGPTPDSYGTYMVLDGADAPFIMEIPGFRGYLSPRFSTYESEWRSQSVFAIPFEEITEVIVEHAQKKEASFKIHHLNNKFDLFTWPDNKSIAAFDTIKVKRFLMELQDKNFNKYIDDVPQPMLDSVKNSHPMQVITVHTIDGTTTRVKAYSKPGWGYVNYLGDYVEKDPDNFFLLINDNEMVYAQYYTFNPLFVEIKSFMKE